ncbi:MAG TPA: zinc metallopeptidase [Saprospiraceae bacterium]|nr:zinc metallopeptidase [Saprospiraceae bacterium]HMX89413.1 zinc metallopeptidase [Saprospiraceae bacterium]HMZ40063.1 zinc metallopeptidase [Saprospiraceae bacterium]HNA64483.1 zinc metallopeptidase [Saprospiraceae bacterium]HNB31249.1 zinc metallopeptidase [Saprospiraceae bacterium]
MDYFIYYLIGGVMTLIGWYIHNKLQSKFALYGQHRLNSGRSGKEIAERMLAHYGISDVQVLQGEGFLSDHYNPLNKTVNLSPEVYSGRSVASAAVAAHECGHAVQHARAYLMLQVRSAIVPVVKIASMAQQFLLMGVFMLGNAFPSLLLITIGVFLVTTIFSVITLPVEFDASRRALVWLEETNEASGSEHDGAKDALKWAAMTYVAQALSALVMLVFLILRYLGSSRD